MPRKVSFSGEHQELANIAIQLADIENTLRYYFQTDAPNYLNRYFGLSAQNALAQSIVDLESRLTESDLTASMNLLSCLEAAFRIDYLQRCYLRRKDALSREFRSLHLKKQVKASLENHILEIWKTKTSVRPSLIGDLRSAFKLRHWLAHGRYWTPKLGQKYDFISLLVLADEVFRTFPLQGVTV